MIKSNFYHFKSDFYYKNHKIRGFLIKIYICVSKDYPKYSFYNFKGITIPIYT